MIQRFRVHARHPQKRLIKKAVAELELNNLVIFPTETLYGIGGSASSLRSLRKLARVKNRKKNKGFIVLINDPREATRFAKNIPPHAKKLMRAFWPGPLTLVFKKRSGIPSALTGGRKTVAIRCTSHPVARALIAAAGPLTAPSANRAGGIPPRSAREAIHVFKGDPEVTFALDAGRSKERQPSTIIDFTGRHPRFLREGVIPIKRVIATLSKLK
jgi:L-threonylcarbamoyladenylate synthase